MGAELLPKVKVKGRHSSGNRRLDGNAVVVSESAAGGCHYVLRLDDGNNDDFWLELDFPIEVLEYMLEQAARPTP